MSTMNADVYDALVDAGASEAKARAAAVAIAGHDDLHHHVDLKFAEMSARLDRLESDIDARFNKVDSDFKLLRQELNADLKLMRWMIAGTFGSIFALLVRSLFFG